MTWVLSKLAYVDMKTRRAKFHLDQLESVVKDWIDSKPYTVAHYDNFQKAIHVCRIQDKLTPELVPMLIGDFVCCLRAALDQLAWALAHLPPMRSFTEREERQIQFPIAKVRDNIYEIKRAFFPPAVASEIDTFQPYLRGNAFKDDPLWQLNELWTMDKHRAIPVNSNSFNIRFRLAGWEDYLVPWTPLNDAVEVHFPLVGFYESPMHLEPEITVEVLFGEHLGQFEVSLKRLREINDFVACKVIPRFAGFFS
jgi:hypothetical protein